MLTWAVCFCCSSNSMDVSQFPSNGVEQMFCLRATKITPLGHMPWVRSFLCRSAFVDPFYAAQPCKYSVNELRRCVLQGLKCEHTANCVTCEAAGERWGGVVGVESRGKRCFMFKGNDSDGMQGTGHSSLHFSPASCKGSWHPRCTFIQQVFMEGWLCSGPCARYFDYTDPA